MKDSSPVQCSNGGPVTAIRIGVTFLKRAFAKDKMVSECGAVDALRDRTAKNASAQSRLSQFVLLFVR